MAKKVYYVFLPIWRQEPHRIELLLEQCDAPNGQSGDNDGQSDDGHFDRSLQKEL